MPRAPGDPLFPPVRKDPGGGNEGPVRDGGTHLHGIGAPLPDGYEEPRMIPGPGMAAVMEAGSGADFAGRGKYRVRLGMVRLGLARLLPPSLSSWGDGRQPLAASR